MQNINLTPKLLVSIVNYQTPELTIECLESINKAVKNKEDIQVSVVENFSQDDSKTILAQAIKERGWDLWATLYISDKNRGYAGGNNIALDPYIKKEQIPEYVLLLNPDSEVRENTIEDLISFMEAHPKAGIAGSRSEHLDKSTLSSAFRFPSAFTDFLGGCNFSPLEKLFLHKRINLPIQDKPHLTDWVSGASMMIRGEVIKENGGLDDNYFLYYEETDYCLEVKKLGWECWHVPSSVILHRVGQSTNVSGDHNAHRRLPGYYFFSRLYFFKKNYHPLYVLFANCSFLIGHSLGVIKNYILGKQHKNRPYYIRDFFYYTFIKGLKKEGIRKWQ